MSSLNSYIKLYKSTYKLLNPKLCKKKPVVYINKAKDIRIKQTFINIQILLIELFNITRFNLGIKVQIITIDTVTMSRILKLNSGKKTRIVPQNNSQVKYIIKKKFSSINTLSIIYNFFYEK